jgi:hypothetical protein
MPVEPYTVSQRVLVASSGEALCHYSKRKKKSGAISRAGLFLLYCRQVQVFTVAAEFSVAVMRPPEFTQPS